MMRMNRSRSAMNDIFATARWEGSQEHRKSPIGIPEDQRRRWIKVGREQCRHLCLIYSFEVTTCTEFTLAGLVRASQSKCPVHLYLFRSAKPHSKVSSDILLHFRVFRSARQTAWRAQRLLQSKKIIKCVLLTRVRSRRARADVCANE